MNSNDHDDLIGKKNSLAIFWQWYISGSYIKLFENIFSSTFSHRKSNNTTWLWYAKHVVCFKQKRWVINTSSIATGIFFLHKAEKIEWKLFFSFTNYTAVDEIFFFTWITVYWKKITFILFFKNLTWKVDFPRPTEYRPISTCKQTFSRQNISVKNCCSSFTVLMEIMKLPLWPKLSCIILERSHGIPQLFTNPDVKLMWNIFHSMNKTVSWNLEVGPTMVIW